MCASVVDAATSGKRRSLPLAEVVLFRVALSPHVYMLPLSSHVPLVRRGRPARVSAVRRVFHRRWAVLVLAAPVCRCKAASLCV